MSNLPTLRSLEAFEAIGRCGGVGAAAVDLGVSPGAISQHLRHLEEALGLRLLERRGRTVEMTSWGRLYYQEISKGFAQFRNAQNVIDRARNAGGIVLSALPSVASRWIGRKVFDWHSTHPEANIRIRGTENEPILGQDEADFRITYGSSISLHEHYAELFTDYVVPVCAPKLLADHTLQRPGDILSFPLLHVFWERNFKPSPQWKDWAQFIGAPYDKVDSSLSFTLSSSAIDAAVAGRGFVLAQISMIAEEIERGSLIIPFDLRLKLHESYWLAWDRAALQKPFAMDFKAWILSVAKQQAKVCASP